VQPTFAYSIFPSPLSGPRLGRVRRTFVYLVLITYILITKTVPQHANILHIVVVCLPAGPASWVRCRPLLGA